ncbi:hypothetical protein HMPREF2821_08360 [Staphylococcus sp. HMSC065C10]|uniref:restriction endonuclease subunit S n=1 Tax=Staphylococcus sp. HMSC065C10 TaxID=1739325 RepID=UPI0008A3AD82|nr:restriction endonuclease subunit S [Staphylococcus sp. HMSC065C10]OFK31645.1 hypothetical protein HMPREF2821_08360 [Staphylococcus sp. HMSC065C10]
MTNEMRNVPELRFPEFDGEWEEKTIGKIATTFSGGTPSSTNRSYYNGEIPFIRSGEISKCSTELMINKEAISNSSAKMVEKGDLLYALYGATSGEVAISKISGAINQAVLCIRSQESVTYIFNYLKMKKDQILKTYIQGGQGNLSASIIKKVDINLPYKEEQKKIGDFFSKLDHQIELEEKKLELLEQQKRGYMQKLFSQELRFKTKDNVYYSEWQLHKLGEIFKYSQGQQISVDKQFSVKNNGMKRFIRIVDITENPEPRFVLYESDTGLVNKGDLFMIRYGRPGIVSIGFEGIIANNLFKLIPKITISTIYFYYLLSYNYYRINLLTNNSTMPALNFKSLDLLKFKIPSYKEQNKIANFLESIDKLVMKQSDKVKLLKQRKKGFLQKMFI